MTDQLDKLMINYAELRRAIIEAPTAPAEPLTYEQRMVALHDSVPAKPDPCSWSAEEYEQKLAEYNRLIGYKLSPLGNYIYRGPRSEDPQNRPLPYMSKEEIRAQPEYGILRRMVEAERAKALSEVQPGQAIDA